jgi:hypothetical protein
MHGIVRNRIRDWPSGPQKSRIRLNQTVGDAPPVKPTPDALIRLEFE